jgi:hypothetical protein
MKKILACLSLCAFLAATAYGGTLSLKFTGGGTYLMGGDYNKSMDGWYDYEQTVLGPAETFVDNLHKLGLGFQFGGEVIYELSPSLAAGLEVGYLSASVESSFSRTWHNYKMTLTPTLSAIPVTLNIHYFLPLGPELRLHATAGAGACLANLNFKYDIQDIYTPYGGAWKPDMKIAFAARAGVGLEFMISPRIALTFDILGRLAEVQGFVGEYSGLMDGVPYGGTCRAYCYDLLGSYPVIVLYENPPSGPSYPNVHEVKFSYSGLSALFGVRINLF